MTYIIVYKQLEIQFERNENNGNVTLSYDEKPGIQAIANTAKDLLRHLLNPRAFLSVFCRVHPRLLFFYRPTIFCAKRVDYHYILCKNEILGKNGR